MQEEKDELKEWEEVDIATEERKQAQVQPISNTQYAGPQSTVDNSSTSQTSPTHIHRSLSSPSGCSRVLSPLSKLISETSSQLAAAVISSRTKRPTWRYSRSSRRRASSKIRSAAGVSVSGELVNSAPSTEKNSRALWNICGG